MITEALVVLVCAAIVVAVFFYMIPMVGRDVALFRVYSLRGQLYDIGRRNPAFRDTLTYRDTEFIMCSIIRVIREESGLDALMFSSLFTRAGQARLAAAVDPEAWRPRRYRWERGTVFANDFDTCEKMYALCDEMQMPLMMRGYSSHPLAWMALLPIGLAYGIYVKFTRQPETDVDKMLVTMEAVHRHPTLGEDLVWGNRIAA